MWGSKFSRAWYFAAVSEKEKKNLDWSIKPWKLKWILSVTTRLDSKSMLGEWMEIFVGLLSSTMQCKCYIRLFLIISNSVFGKVIVCVGTNDIRNCHANGVRPTLNVLWWQKRSWYYFPKQQLGAHAPISICAMHIVHRLFGLFRWNFALSIRLTRMIM